MDSNECEELTTDSDSDDAVEVTDGGQVNDVNENQYEEEDVDNPEPVEPDNMEETDEEDEEVTEVQMDSSRSILKMPQSQMKDPMLVGTLVFLKSPTL